MADRRKRGGRVMREAAPDFGTPELHRQHLVVIEGSQLAGDKPHARVVDQRPLDRYFARGLLSIGRPSLNAVLFAAGDRLRGDWYLAGLEPKMTIRLLSAGAGRGEMTDRQVSATADKDRALRAVGPLLVPVLVSVVCSDTSAEEWAVRAGLAGRMGLPALRIALGRLALHYGMY